MADFYEIKESCIHGWGVFAKRPFQVGDVIIDTHRQFQRYCNDAAMPDICRRWNISVIKNHKLLIEDYHRRSSQRVNVKVIPNNILVCIKPIAENDEFLISYGLEKWSRELSEGCRMQ